MAQDDHFPHAMSEQDAMFWNLERGASLSSTVSAVSLLDRMPDRAFALRKLERAVRSIPRLRQRVVVLPRLLSTPVWEECTDFDLSYHVRWISAPGDGSLAGVLELAAALAMQPFDRNRPLWELTIVDGVEGDGAAIIQKLHHCVTDGAAGIRMMREFFDLERDAPLPDLPRHERNATLAPQRKLWRIAAEQLGRQLREQPRVAREGVKRITGAIRRPIDTLHRGSVDFRALASMLSSGPGPMSPFMRGRSRNLRFAVLDLRTDSLKSAAHTAGCKLNDAFLAGIAAGFSHYHARLGHVPETLQLSFPVSLRGEGSVTLGGNHLGITRILLPLGSAKPTARIRACHELVSSQRERPSDQAMELVAAATNRLPPSLLGVVAHATGSNDLIASCVRGLKIPLFMAGSRIESLYAFGPLAGAAVNLTLLSYREQSNIAVVLDPAAIPDPELLLRSLREGFDEILKTG